jgi:acetolactate synthase small subunit
MADYTILEICRTGVVSLERGSSTIRKVTNL